MIRDFLVDFPSTQFGLFFAFFFLSSEIGSLGSSCGRNAKRRLDFVHQATVHKKTQQNKREKMAGKDSFV